jgi:cell division protein ZipA
MDADQLRLILLVLGFLLIVGIYLWDRVTRRPPRPHARDRRREPAIEPQQADVEDADEDLAEMVAAREESRSPVELGAWDELKLDAEPVLDDELSFDAHGVSDYLHLDPQANDGIPRLIIQFQLVGRNGPLRGDRIAQAAAEVELQAGQMDIFHRYDAHRTDQVLFSLASLIEPGSFRFDDLAGFETPGVILFTQLPGLRDGLAIYSDMLFTAERLAAILDAELRDERHNPLTKQWIEHTRERVLEHRRQVQLARSRH